MHSKQLLDDGGGVPVRIGNPAFSGFELDMVIRVKIEIGLAILSGC